MTDEEIDEVIENLPQVREILERHGREIPENFEPMLALALNSQIIPAISERSVNEGRGEIPNPLSFCEERASEYRGKFRPA